MYISPEDKFAAFCVFIFGREYWNPLYIDYKIFYHLPTFHICVPNSWYISKRKDISCSVHKSQWRSIWVFYSKFMNICHKLKKNAIDKLPSSPIRSTSYIIYSYHIVLCIWYIYNESLVVVSPPPTCYVMLCFCFMHRCLELAKTRQLEFKHKYWYIGRSWYTYLQCTCWTLPWRCWGQTPASWSPPAPSPGPACSGYASW